MEGAGERGASVTPWVRPGSAAMTAKCCQTFTSAHAHGRFHHSMTLNRRRLSTGRTDAHTLYSCSLCEIRHAVPPNPLVPALAHNNRPARTTRHCCTVSPASALISYDGEIVRCGHLLFQAGTCRRVWVRNCKPRIACDR